jgi:hypothetical protein
VQGKLGDLSGPWSLKDRESGDAGNAPGRPAAGRNQRQRARSRARPPASRRP